MTNTQKEELRRLVLGWLAQRAALAFNVSSVQRGVSREMAATEPEVLEALLFLESQTLLQIVPNSLGATRYFQITATGTLVYERGQ